MTKQKATNFLKSHYISLSLLIKNYFQGVKIYFQGMIIYFQSLIIYFQSLKIIYFFTAWAFMFRCYLFYASLFWLLWCRRIYN